MADRRARGWGWLLLVLSVAAQARQLGEPRSWAEADKSLDAIPLLQLPAIDRAALLAEDARGAEQRKGGGALRFAQILPSSHGTADHGRWRRLADGSRLWQLRVAAPNATDLNMTIARARLPAGTELHLFSTSEKYYEGPYTGADLQTGGRFWSPLLPGEQAVIELYQPAGAEAPELQLGAVNAGYRDLLGREGAPMTKRGSCNINVVCPLGDDYRDDIRSVASYLIDGQFLCTGTLMMDANRSFTPWFLTAAHCDVSTEALADSLVFYWNFQSPTCDATAGGSKSQTQTGSAFRARRVDVDMGLVELDQRPDPAFNVYYAGWDRSNTAPSGSIHIHHPNGDEKAISFNDDLLTTGNSCIGTGGTNSHWIIDNYEQGTTEPGSSGSGVWTQAPTPRVIGFLSGGGASCSNLGAGDCYGKLSVAWTGNSAAERLSDWLGNGLVSPPLTVDGSDPQGFDVGVAAASVDICPGSSGQVEVTVDSIGGFSSAVSLSLPGAPTGITGAFSPNPVTPVATSTLTLSASGVTAGSYPLTVRGSAGALVDEVALSAQVLAGAPTGAPTLSAPAAASTVDRFPSFSWSAVSGATRYRLQIAASADFSSPLLDTEVATTSHSLSSPLPAGSSLFWRVTPLNDCGSGTPASSSFTTSSALCVAATVAIPDNSAGGVSRSIVLSDSELISDLDVSLAITHTYVGDLRAVLSRSGGGSATLLDQPGKPATNFGCSGNDVSATLDDEAASAAENQCAGSVPTINGSFSPATALGAFDGQSLAGTWTLTVSDLASPDNGSLTRWCLLPTLAEGDRVFQDGFEGSVR